MSLIDIRAHIDCDVCGAAYTVTFDHAQDTTPWECVMHAIGTAPMKDGGFIDGEFVCHECLAAFDAALISKADAVGDLLLFEHSEEFRSWRLEYQAFLDDAEHV